MHALLNINIIKAASLQVATDCNAVEIASRFATQKQAQFIPRVNNKLVKHEISAEQALIITNFMFDNIAQKQDNQLK